MFINPEEPKLIGSVNQMNDLRAKLRIGTFGGDAAKLKMKSMKLDPLQS